MLPMETHSRVQKGEGTGMKKNNKKETAKSKRQAQKVDELRAQMVGLAEREAMALVVGIDPGDRTSACCVRTMSPRLNN
jgi:hypothetical protein